MVENNRSYTPLGLFFLVLISCWFAWVWLSSAETLEAIAFEQQQESCEVSMLFCESWHEHVVRKAQIFLEDCFNFVNDFPIKEVTIEAFLVKVHFLGVIAIERMGQIVLCLILSSPIVFFALKLGALKVRIDRLDFNGELPSIMRHKWILLKWIVFSTIALCLIPLAISMQSLLVLVGLLLLCFGWVWAVTWETNQP